MRVPSSTTGAKQRPVGSAVMAETLSPVLSDATEQRVDEILRTLCERDQTLSMAESCTGGLLSSLFTDVPGCSHAFIAGYVSYTNDAKSDMLGVDPMMIEENGAVSRSVAIAMAEGALDRSGSDYALSITGFAGGAGEGEEDGLVFMACAIRDGLTAHEDHHFGAKGRGDIRLMCVRAAVSLLHRSVVTSAEFHP